MSSTLVPTSSAVQYLPPKRIHSLAEGFHQAAPVEGTFRSQDDGLAAAERKIGSGGLQRHAARQPQHVRKCIRARGIVPHAASARGRSPHAAVHCDDRLQAGAFVLYERYALMMIELAMLEDHRTAPLARSVFLSLIRRKPSDRIPAAAAMRFSRRIAAPHVSRRRKSILFTPPASVIRRQAVGSAHKTPA